MCAARPPARWLVALALCLLAGLPAAAQQRALQLTVGEGQLIRLERDSATVLLSDPEVADIQTPAARQIFVFARRQAGQACSPWTRRASRSPPGGSPSAATPRRSSSCCGPSLATRPSPWR